MSNNVTSTIDTESIAEALVEIAGNLRTESFFPGGTIADAVMSAGQDIAAAIRFHGACTLAAAVSQNTSYNLREDRTQYAGDALYEIMEQFSRPSITGSYKEACGG
jgi:hypothetical protein